MSVPSPSVAGFQWQHDRMADGVAQEFSLRRIAVPAFGPSTLWSIGNGAILPVIALSARELGASVGVAALFVGIAAASELLFAVPAGIVVDRFGERRALILAGLGDAGACVLAFLAPNLSVLAVALALMGPTGAVFLLARQSYLTAAAPVPIRARAMSTLGGVTRIGYFIGPLIGAPVVAAWGPAGGYAVAAIGGLAAAAIAVFSSDLVVEESESAKVKVRLGTVVRENARVFLTVGIGVIAIGLARSARVVAVPLWAEHIGLSAAQTSLTFAAAFAVEVLLFYPAGSIMDRFGRVWVAVPVAAVLGICLLVLPLTNSLVGVAAVSVAMGVGNGLGSGIVMTLGADAAPERGRATFLGVWRLISLVGHNGAAVVIGAVAAVATIGVASIAVGSLAIIGGAWLARWVPQYDPRAGAPTAVERAGAGSARGIPPREAD